MSSTRHRRLSVTQKLYGEKMVSSPLREFAPFTIVPYWNTRGVAEEGGFGDGTSTHCQFIGGGNHCVKIAWQGDRYSDRAATATSKQFWHGALLQRNEDGGGTLYKRNRYYDTKTGQFTQEDPIGVAGGLNLYGFAAGDPVNYGDPFGTFPWPLLLALFEAGSTASDVWQLVSTLLDGEASGSDRNLAVAAVFLGAVAPGPGSAYVKGVREAGKRLARWDGVMTSDEALGFAERWLGKGYKELDNGVFRSADDLRQFRMTINDLLDPRGMHVNVEAFGPGGTRLWNAHN
jgi:RHS repeat-associated protein